MQTDAVCEQAARLASWHVGKAAEARVQEILNKGLPLVAAEWKRTAEFHERGAMTLQELANGR